MRTVRRLPGSSPTRTAQLEGLEDGAPAAILGSVQDSMQAVVEADAAQ